MQDNDAARIRPGFNTFGAGAQHNNLGSGSQNNNSGTGNQYNATNINIVNKENDTFLADLRVTDPRDDKARIERTKGDLQVDCYHWILENYEYRQWRSNKEKRLLWIKGGPGKGKTMLLCGVIDELFEKGYNSTFFFFCQAADARINTANSVLRGLLSLILDQNPVLCDLLRRKFDKAGVGRKLFEDVNSWEVLCKMIKFAVSHKTLQNVVLVIDALDECTSGLDRLIRLIIDLAAQVQIIVSSRPELRIDRGLAAASDGTKICLSLELNEDVISAAVSSYIHHKVENLANLKKFDDDMKLKVCDYLVEKADNTFLWVALVYEQLADNRVGRRHMERKLEEFPPGLDSLYRRILEQILGSLDHEDCRQVLAIVSTVSRPIDLKELALILDHIDFLDEIVAECGSLLVVRGGVIYFTHQSARDFLTGQANSIMPSGIGPIHNLILSKLLQSMSNTLRRNIYDIEDQGTSLDKILVPSPDPLSSVRYACLYWADHVTAEYTGQEQFEEFYAFITKHFLHWIESLSLLQSMPVSILSMSRIQRIIEASTQPEEAKLLFRDATSFARYFGALLEVNPMQVYFSALVFSPKNSIIRAIFRHEEPNWPFELGVDEHWSSCLYTLQGHRDEIISLSFSLDETMIASASKDNTVKLWDTTTGQCIQTLNTKVPAACIAFSSDGSTLVLTSSNAIGFRNTRTGRYNKTLRTNRDPRYFALSPDKVTLAMLTSNVFIIEVWNIDERQHVRLLEGHSKRIESVVFSADGSLIASASAGNTVMLWETSTGACLISITHYSELWIAFSHNQPLIAFDTVDGWKVGDLFTDEIFHLRRDQSHMRKDIIAISWDGVRLAYSMKGGGIQAWDVASNLARRTQSDYHGVMTSLVTHRGGNLLASTSKQQPQSIKLWDLTMDQQHALPPLTLSSPTTPLEPILIRQTSSLSIVKNAISYIGVRQLNAKGTHQTSTSTITSTMKANPHSEPIHTLSYACGGSRAISVSLHRTCVWDTATLQLLQTLETGGHDPCTATIINDCVHIAELFKGQIHVGDITRGRHLRTLEIHSHPKGPKVVSLESSYRRGEPAFADMNASRLDVSWIRFETSKYHLDTSLGIIELGAVPKIIPRKPSARHHQGVTTKGYSFRWGDSWIMKDGKRALWLPSEYRTNEIQMSTIFLAILFSHEKILPVPFN